MKAKILVIEDSEPINELICINLETAGYDPMPFLDGDALCTWLENISRQWRPYQAAPVLSNNGCENPDRLLKAGTSAGISQPETPAADLAILDVMLPGQDGFTLLPKLRALDIPVIFLTAKDDLNSKIHGLKNGAEDYIVKPFEMLELLVRVEKVLARYQKDESSLIIRDVEIFLKERRVKKAGKEVALKPMEFDCLLLLVKYKNIALSREQLIRSLWGVDFDGETRTIDVHIARLRKKLDFQDVIRTVPRIGYRLEDDG
ncbi:MAG: response regulator transcription factor [Lachnospiraceae bacterium]|nr:response regulator transcription factor [Lachnospiraceae bacterium]